jgi:hypothetical protein
VNISSVYKMDKTSPELAPDESLAEGTIILHLIDQREGGYRLFSRDSNGEMKYTGNFEAMASAQAYADMLDRSKN